MYDCPIIYMYTCAILYYCHGLPLLLCCGDHISHVVLSDLSPAHEDTIFITNANFHHIDDVSPWRQQWTMPPLYSNQWQQLATRWPALSGGLYTVCFHSYSYHFDFIVFDVVSFYCLIAPHHWSITKCGLHFNDIDCLSCSCVFFTVSSPLISGLSPSATCFNDINHPTSMQQAVMTMVATHDDNWP